MHPNCLTNQERMKQKKYKWKSFTLFLKAFAKTKHEMWVSVQVLFFITIVLSVILCLVESGDLSNWWNSLTWSFMQYIEDPGEFADYRPVTFVGRIIAVLIGIIGIAIFAVPAGLIGSGFIDAINDDKRENELHELRNRIRKAFRRDKDKLLSKYLNELPDKQQVKADLYFVPQEIPVYKLQARQNMDLKDIIDCCKKYPEIRLKNMAQIGTTIEDLFVVEHAFLNCCYGAFIDRESRVTIVSTSSYAEKGTGWFAYYLALFGNFNFISKDVEVDVDDQDPFYNLNPEPRHDMKTLKGLNKEERTNKKLVEKLTLKQAYRDAYFNDLYECCKNRQDAWFIVIKEHKTNDPDDKKIYLTANKKDGSLMMINDADFYNTLCQDFVKLMEAEEHLGVVTLSDLYSLKDSYAINLMKKKHADVSCNSFVMRPASDLMNSANKLIVAHRIARFLSAKLDNGRDMRPVDEQELSEEGFGFKEDKNFEKSKKEAEDKAKKMV